MKFANLVNIGLYKDNDNRIVNLGDTFQIMAIDQLYKKLGIPEEEIVPIKVYELDSYDGEYVILPINFILPLNWYGKDALKISDKIIPVFLGVSFTEIDFTETQIRSLKKWEPIGCRDERAMRILRKHGIQSYLSGCLVTTLERINSEKIEENAKKPEKIVFINVPSFIEPYIPENIRENIVYLEHEFYLGGDVLQNDISYKNYSKERIEYYAREAKMIVTSRFHGAAIALALNIPVIVIIENNFYKFSWLSKWVPFYDRKNCSDICWEPKAVNFDSVKEMMVNVALKRIRSTYERYSEQLSLSECLENKNRSDEGSLIYIQDAIDFIEEHWNKNIKIEYGIWGVSKNAEILYQFISENYKNAVLTTVFDGLRTAEFHGIQSEMPSEDIKNNKCFIFVVSNTASKPAEELFHKIDKKDYFICKLNFLHG